MVTNCDNNERTTSTLGKTDFKLELHHFFNVNGTLDYMNVNLALWFSKKFAENRINSHCNCFQGFF